MELKVNIYPKPIYQLIFKGQEYGVFEDLDEALIDLNAMNSDPENHPYHAILWEVTKVYYHVRKEESQEDD